MPSYLEVTTIDKHWHIDNPLQCPIVNSINVIGGKWKPIILHMLSSGTLRFGQIKRNIPPVSQKVLTQQLKELESDGVIVRTSFSEKSLKVEYKLSTSGENLIPALEALHAWNASRSNI